MSKSWFNGTVASTTFNVVDHQCGGVLFVNGFGGSRKTFVWNTLTFGLRGCGDIVLADRMLKDICGENNPECHKKPFGEKVVVFGSDFRQILPIIARVDPIQAVVESTYPSFIDNYGNQDYIRDRVVLAPTLDDVTSTNEHMLPLLLGEESTYLNSCSVSNQDPTSKIPDIYTTAFLNTIFGSELPYIIS
ncbi:ATP-dependent DNA helicase PIF1-like [Senna tora]|uniref:ATP-dependent DNA helicase n=1 Tax=Senna tora TaxID=362788 RepID=A0A834TUK7_9FABA|nr:ATP-dependent DNA helicase PIF1-like [Senna tora]KAF7826951.1 ATP-dependent DNA helicase PIF1-like [Senna tora]